MENMERVWEELKKIEAEAEKIRVGAQQIAREITSLAQRNSEKLVAKSHIYAQEEGQRLYDIAVEEANVKQKENLRANEAAAEKLKEQASGHMDQAAEAVLKAIVKEASV